MALGVTQTRSQQVLQQVALPGPKLEAYHMVVSIARAYRTVSILTKSPSVLMMDHIYIQKTFLTFLIAMMLRLHSLLVGVLDLHCDITLTQCSWQQPWQRSN